MEFFIIVSPSSKAASLRPPEELHEAVRENEGGKPLHHVREYRNPLSFQQIDPHKEQKACLRTLVARFQLLPNN
jgi:hypothetical protein